MMSEYADVYARLVFLRNEYCVRKIGFVYDGESLHLVQILPGGGLIVLQ